MLKTIVSFLFLFVVTNSFATGWLNSFEDAQKLALAQNKLIVVDFWATWCGPCLKMDRESWSDPAVENLMQSFVPVKIDIDKQKSLARSYGINAIPDVFIMDGNGEIIHHHKGYMNSNDLKRELEKYLLNTQFLNRHAVQFFQKPQYNTAFKLAERYMDFALNIPEEEVRQNFLSVAENYLEKSEDLLVDTMSSYDLFEERLALYDLMIDLYRGKTSKVIRVLDKDYSESTVNPKNKAALYFLKSCLCDPSDPDLMVLSEKLKSTDVTGNFQTRVQWYQALE